MSDGYATDGSIVTAQYGVFKELQAAVFAPPGGLNTVNLQLDTTSSDTFPAGMSGVLTLGDTNVNVGTAAFKNSIVVFNSPTSTTSGWAQATALLMFGNVTLGGSSVAPVPFLSQIYSFGNNTFNITEGRGMANVMAVGTLNVVSGGQSSLIYGVTNTITDTAFNIVGGRGNDVFRMIGTTMLGLGNFISAPNLYVAGIPGNEYFWQGNNFVMGASNTVSVASNLQFHDNFFLGTGVVVDQVDKGWTNCSSNVFMSTALAVNVGSSFREPVTGQFAPIQPGVSADCVSSLQVYGNTVLIGTNPTLGGVRFMDIAPETAAAPLVANSLTNKTYVDAGVAYGTYVPTTSVATQMTASVVRAAFKQHGLATAGTLVEVSVSLSCTFTGAGNPSVQLSLPAGTTVSTVDSSAAGQVQGSSAVSGVVILANAATVTLQIGNPGALGATPVHAQFFYIRA
jgi:hypothetical protein